MKIELFQITKSETFQEIAKTTSWTGAKMKGDVSAYDRIFTTDEDKEMLERFWNESKNSAADKLKKVLVAETEHNGIYTLELGLSNSFDENLIESMRRSLFSFFVLNITAKWYTLTNKEEAEGYAATAASLLDDFLHKAFYKKKPVRPTY